MSYDLRKQLEALAERWRRDSEDDIGAFSAGYAMRECASELRAALAPAADFVPSFGALAIDWPDRIRREPGQDAPRSPIDSPAREDVGPDLGLVLEEAFVKYLGSDALDALPEMGWYYFCEQVRAHSPQQEPAVWMTVQPDLTRHVFLSRTEANDFSARHPARIVPLYMLPAAPDEEQP